LIALLLKFVHFEDDEKTAELVTSTVNEHLLALGLTSEHYTVTDEGSNMLGFGKVFLKYAHFVLGENQSLCHCHLLSTVIKHMSTPYKRNCILPAAVLNDCAELVEALTGLKRLIRLARQNDVICDALGTALSPSVSTRFATEVHMTEQYLKNLDRIHETLEKHSAPLLELHNELLDNYRPIYIAYVQVGGMISDFIPQLEVSQKV
jgi:hypothetical protein